MSKIKTKPKSEKRSKQLGGPQSRRKHKRQCGGALFTVLKNAAKIGKDKMYKSMGAKGVTGSYNRRPAPCEV